jgi:putative transposase
MPRQAWLILPYTPHHVIQRGHNRQDVFTSDNDDTYYLDSLKMWKAWFVKVYAYCLMTNHVHLLLVPGEAPEALSLLMKRVAARQTRYVNRRERRTGTLWARRYKSSPVETERYLLACCRSIELNPVRAGMVRHPEEYWWSSYPDKGGLRHSPWRDVDPWYQGLGSAATERACR